MKKPKLNRKQYLLLCSAKTRLKQLSRKEKRLRRINRDPEQQYDWDQWAVSSGAVYGLSIGIAYLTLFIEAADT